VIPVEMALEIVLSHTPMLPKEEVLLADALGRVLGEDVRSDLDLPPFDRAGMDGYALRAGDAAQAPVTLEVVGQTRAGQWPEQVLASGQAVEVMTGAPVPAGATAVQQVENTRVHDGGRRVEILVPVETGQNIARQGSEVRAGDPVLAGGETLDPAAIGVLAAVGKGRVRVGRRPTVSVLVTGDELVDVWERPSGGRIRNSNGYALLAQARWAGADVTSLAVLPDQVDRIAEGVREGFRSDVLVLFTRVAIKPGAPLVFGRRGDKLVFGLPGNPVSAQVTFDIFVRAALLRLQGARQVSRPTVEVELMEAVKNRSGRKAHLPARVRSEGGRLLASPVSSRGSADLVAHAKANALLVLEATRTRAEAGERAPALLLGNFLERDGAPV